MLQLATLMAQHAQYRPDQVAVVFENERLTWRDFAARVSRCASLLQALGVRRGDRVAQLVLAPVTRASWLPVDELDETARGEGGFGSTGGVVALGN